MSQRPVVYVSRITNLSDARYCAGMGVELLGFVVDPNDPDYVSPKVYQEMVGWISGPLRVAQLINSPSIVEVVASYEPDLMHFQDSFGTPADYDTTRIMQVPFSQYESLANRWPLFFSPPAYVVVTDLPDLQTLLALRKDKLFTIPVLLSIDNQYGSVKTLLDTTGARGIMLQGAKEAQPGLKDYEHLAGILEELEN